MLDFYLASNNLESLFISVWNEILLNAMFRSKPHVVLTFYIVYVNEYTIDEYITYIFVSL